MYGVAQSRTQLKRLSSSSSSSFNSALNFASYFETFTSNKRFYLLMTTGGDYVISNKYVIYSMLSVGVSLGSHMCICVWCVSRGSCLTIWTPLTSLPLV